MKVALPRLLPHIDTKKRVAGRLGWVKPNGSTKLKTCCAKSASSLRRAVAEKLREAAKLYNHMDERV